MKQRRSNFPFDDKRSDDDLEDNPVIRTDRLASAAQTATSPSLSPNKMAASGVVPPIQHGNRRRGIPPSRAQRPTPSPRRAYKRPRRWDDVLFQRLIVCFLFMCPVSFLFSMFLSAYVLEHMDGKDYQTVIDAGALPNQMGRWFPNKMRGMLPSLWWVDEIDMRDLAYTLPFDNPDGGVWTQGWELDPVPIGFAHDTLEIFVVPHSHCDPGWIKTFDQYFQTQTKEIISTVVDALKADPRRKFIWAEISYLEWWWREQTAEKRQDLQMLLDNGQFEIVTGSWVMPDEANSQLYALEIQMQEGHDWIRENLGAQHIPSYAWSIDPFGYSPTMAYLLAKHNFTGMVIQRVHYAVKKELARRQHLEFKWRQTWDASGQYDIWTHVLPFFSYDIPHSCGPDPSICCQFDFARRRTGIKSRTCPWKKPPQVITDENIEERAKLLLDQYRKKASLYRSRAVLVPLGDDFRFQGQKEAEDQFTNYQRLFDYINRNFVGVRIQFGTLKDYFQAAERADVKLPLLKGSFFTYSDVNEDYWSGYYTSRVFDKALGRQLERKLFAAERLGVSKDELREPRRALSLFQHHDGVTGTATSRVVHDYAYRMKNAVEVTQDMMLKYLKSEFSNVVQSQFQRMEEMKPCFLSGSPRGLANNLCGDTSTILVYNPLASEQRCRDTKIKGNQATFVSLPCEVPGPVKGSKTKLVFDATTGLLLEPFREEWMGWHVKRGGAYLFYPYQEFHFDRENRLIPANDGYSVSAPGWSRTIVEQPVPYEYEGRASVIDFIYETNLESDNEEWFVRFSADIDNQGYFHTDLNGFNFDVHRFRQDMPIQSQVFPMPTHVSIQDKKHRLTVLSEHSQGTASLQNGSVDVWLDRRLAQEDGRGLGQGIQDNVPTRTRLRVIIERDVVDDGKNFQVSEFVRRYWEELQHPLEYFGTHVKQLDQSEVVVDPAAVEQKRLERQQLRAKIRNTNDGAVTQSNESVAKKVFHGRNADPFMDDKMNGGLAPEQKNMVEHGDVPFVFMVYNRLHYLNQTMDSLRQSDFPRESVPVIISHDGHIPEMVDYVESLKKHFKIIQLFHPFSCHDHPDTFPGNDERLNEGFKGDKAGNPRTGTVTCAKHHFAWMLNEVFSLNITTARGQANHFAFLEEDYVLGPTIYEAIRTGLSVLDEADKVFPGGLIGLELDPTLAGARKEQTGLKDQWYTFQFMTGPMTLSRQIFHQIQENADTFCSFDDYNWDWSMVKLANEGKIPSAILAPARMLAKHIGVEGMHTEQLKKIKQKQDSVELVPWVGRGFAKKPVGRRKAPGFGGWAHPVDQEHCRNLFSGKPNVTRLLEFWEEAKQQ